MSMYSIEQIAEYLKADIINQDNISDNEIKGVNTLEDSTQEDITFLGNGKYASELKKSDSVFIIVSKKFVKDLDLSKKIFFVVEDAYFSFALMLSLFEDKDENNGYISKNVSLSPYCDIEDKVTIEDFVKIDKNCFIGENTHIYSGVSIEKGCSVGKNCIIYENVVIRKNTIIGDNVIIHPGTVLGGDGFGFVPVKGTIHKIPHIGKVEIKDNVEIGCNVTIDRGVVGSTIIGSGTKIDNLVHIAHNVKIGKNCFIVAQVGISGSVKIGDNVKLAGQTGVVGHLEIKDNVTVGARSVVMNNIEKGAFVSGFPAVSHFEDMRMKASLRKLPSILKKMRKDEKK